MIRTLIPEKSLTIRWSRAAVDPICQYLDQEDYASAITGRIFGFTMSAGYFGVFGGSVLGGQVAAWLGSRYVFIVTGALLLTNAAWVYFKVFKKLEGKRLSF